MNRIVFMTALIISALTVPSSGANLANPAAPVADARISLGASYHLGGYTISNMEIPMVVNRFHGRISYSPIRYVNFGIDLGTIQINVERFIEGRDTIPVFEGAYGFSGGAHLKLTTPQILNTLSMMAMAQGGMFQSENKAGAMYGGKDGVAALGLQVRIPQFGYISAGPQLYIINGENRSYSGTESIYSNVNNVRGWIAFDYFPKVEPLTTNKPYFSLEFTASPKINSTSRIPVQEFSVSLSIGAITPRLYGLENETDGF